MITETKNILKISNNQVFLQHSVKQRRTREQLANMTKQERSFIYDHKSQEAKLRKSKRIVKDLISNRKRISLYMLITVPIVKKRERSNDYYFNYIYINNSSTKKITFSKKGNECMSNEQRWASVTVNTNQLFKNDERERDYVSNMSDNAYYAIRNPEKNKKNTIDATQNNNTIQTEQKNSQKTVDRSNISGYRAYVHKKRFIPALSQQQALEKIVAIANDPSARKFLDSLGKDEAAQHLKRIMEHIMTEKNQ